MEQNKQSAPQNAASEAAVRRQKLADLKRRRPRPVYHHQMQAGCFLC